MKFIGIINLIDRSSVKLQCSYRIDPPEGDEGEAIVITEAVDKEGIDWWPILGLRSRCSLYAQALANWEGDYYADKAAS